MTALVLRAPVRPVRGCKQPATTGASLLLIHTLHWYMPLHEQALPLVCTSATVNCAGASARSSPPIQHRRLHQVATLEHQLQCRNEPYILTLHQPCDKKQDSILPAGSQQLHKLQQWFGISTFVLIAPATYSGRILDQQVCPHM